jgi:hypothetical protein
MKVSTLMLADHAEAVNGKLYVTGGCWDRLFTTQLPTQHPHLSLAASVQVPWNATNEKHVLGVTLVDEDGRDVLPQRFTTQFEVGRPAGLMVGTDITTLFVMNFNALSFSKPGRYAFILSIDDEEVGRAPFDLVQIQGFPVTG